jgi:hypothetical protein
MSEPAALERGYRRLLAWYPRSFRAAQEEEILAVLMAGAEQGQRRPRFAEAVDLIRSAVRMRLWPGRSGPERRDLADGLAVFSLVAPLFLLAADVLQVVLPYRPPRSPFLFHPGNLESGGVALLRVHFFDIWAGLGVILAVLVLLGLRWLALLAIPAMLVYFAVSNMWLHWIPDPLVLITAGVLLLEFAALLCSPGPRRGRELATWRHGVMLLLAAGSLQAFALWYAVTTPPYYRWLFFPHPGAAGYLVTGAGLAVAALVLAVVFRLNRYFLLAFAAACYPCAIQLVFNQGRAGLLGLRLRPDLLGNPSAAHLAVLFGPSLVFVLGVMVTAALRMRASVEPAAPA